MKHLVSLWKELTPTEKSPYVDAARIDKERFLTEKENYETLHQAEEEISHKRRTDDNSKKKRRSDRRQGSVTLHDALSSFIFSDISNRLNDNTKNVSTDLEERKRFVVLKLEKILKEPFVKETHWPIAGRKLFDPEGSLSKPVVKWLGRNGGIKRVPNVTYVSKFEVGLPSVFQLWRKKTLSCSSYEKFIFQIRFLESFINKSVSNFSIHQISYRCYFAGVNQLHFSILYYTKRL